MRSCVHAARIINHRCYVFRTMRSCVHAARQDCRDREVLQGVLHAAWPHLAGNELLLCLHSQAHNRQPAASCQRKCCCNAFRLWLVGTGSARSLALRSATLRLQLIPVCTLVFPCHVLRRSSLASARRHPKPLPHACYMAACHVQQAPAWHACVSLNGPGRF
jgi:hypothetical protein